MKEKMWALMVIMSHNQWMWPEKDPKPFDERVKGREVLCFDDSFWEYILEESVKVGINTILLDVGDGVQYASHPEISLKNAWSKKRVHEEIERCAKLGIKIIPKINFATPHSFWLGEYRRMTSTNTYYRVCSDIIKEIYEMFEHPEYIHLGMDEEGYDFSKGHGLVVYRQGELFWHDLRFLIDCVKETGATPWIWHSPLFDHTEEYKAHIDPDEAVISPYFYHALKEGCYTRTDSRQEYIDYYRTEGGQLYHLHLDYVEDDPFSVNFRAKALPLLKEGYKYIPCPSVFHHCDRNTRDLLEYFKEGAPDDQIIGYVAAPWFDTTWEQKANFDETFYFLKEAKKEIYGIE